MLQFRESQRIRQDMATEQQKQQHSSSWLKKYNSVKKKIEMF